MKTPSLVVWWCLNNLHQTHCQNILNMNRQQKHRWSLNFAKKSDQLDRTKSSEIIGPPGYNCNHGYIQNESSREVDTNLIVKKSWDIALQPLKQIPMNLFIMYMAGNSISILPIMMVGMLFLGPIKAIFSFNKTFKLIEGNQAIMQKLIYLIGNLAGIALALYKCKSMGLLPTHPSDWLDFVEPSQRVEFSGGGLST